MTGVCGVGTHWCDPWEVLARAGEVDGVVEGWGGVGGEVERNIMDGMKVLLHILFWNVKSLIFSGENSVGGSGVRAVPAAGDWIGV